MGKLISHIQNYPLSAGAIAYDNRTLLDDTYVIRDHSLDLYFRNIFEFSKDVYFFNDAGSHANRWNDLIGKDSVFQFSRFLSISGLALESFFTNLPQTNHFNSDVELTQDEYEVLCYQRLQLIQYLLLYYKIIGESASLEYSTQVLSILKGEPISKLYLAYQFLSEECLQASPKLIKLVNRKPLAKFYEINLPLLEEGFSISLKQYFNPSNDSGNLVLGIYPTKFDKVKAANEYAHSIFRSILQIHQTFHHYARKRLNELITSTNTHQPHIAILISFCRLKLLYDARYNQLIHGHTKFIYEDILQIKREAILPDTALVSIELAKNVTSYFIERNTPFKAGKNNLGKQVYYRSDEDVVLNGAKIAFIKSCVRVYKEQQLFTVSATDDASNVEWQVNDAWMPFNDLNVSYTGIAFESKLLHQVKEKEIPIQFVFTFDQALPASENLAEKFIVLVVLADGSEQSLPINVVTIDNLELRITIKSDKDLQPLRTGINTKIKIVSPLATEAEDASFVALYAFLLTQSISKINVRLNEHGFTPVRIDIPSGIIEGTSSFMAFGAQSLAGSSFKIIHPIIRYANDIRMNISWAETLKENVNVQNQSNSYTFNATNETSHLSDLVKSGDKIIVKLKNDVTYTLQSTVKNGTSTSTIETSIPRVLQVKEINLIADINEQIYANAQTQNIVDLEIYSNPFTFPKSLQIPFTTKSRQKKLIYERHIHIRRRLLRYFFNNRLAHLYPFGALEVNKTTGLTFLPDYSILGFNDYEADMYIGLQDITQGQSISLLFNIADETAEQSQREAKITWYFISENGFAIMDASRIKDGTKNFLQSGIVRLTLPETATNENTIVKGTQTFWLVARCDKNYDVVANIKSIKTNGISVTRVLDDLNNETKISAPPATIENIYPKTANVKSVSQPSPSGNGREEENDRHFFWRVSQRLRHKSRAIQQWDYEQLVLEKFSSMYKVKCLNHAQYHPDDASIIAKATNVIVTVIPHFALNATDTNFQPAIPVSRLLEIKQYLLSKTSPFIQLQVLNTQWDEVRIELEVILAKDITDLVYYRDRLNLDLKRFLSPWAMDGLSPMTMTNKIYFTTLVDYVDELPYTDHIRSLHIFKNSLEVYDKIVSSSEIHLLTSAPDHKITTTPYGQ